jgi:hypothetical protein
MSKIEETLERHWFDNGIINENSKFKSFEKDGEPGEDDICLFAGDIVQGKYNLIIVSEYIGTNKERKIFREFTKFTHWLLLPLNTIK